MCKRRLMRMNVVSMWFDPTVMRLMEVRLVWDRCARHYTWHLVVENGKTPKQAKGATTVAVDLGEVHPAVATDGQTAIVVSCRELRAKRQYTVKRLAYPHPSKAALTRGRVGGGACRGLRTAFAPGSSGGCATWNTRSAAAW
jgi:hypothetical protein